MYFEVANKASPHGKIEGRSRTMRGSHQLKIDLIDATGALCGIVTIHIHAIEDRYAEMKRTSIVNITC